MYVLDSQIVEIHYEGACRSLKIYNLRFERNNNDIVNNPFGNNPLQAEMKVSKIRNLSCEYQVFREFNENSA